MSFEDIEIRQAERGGRGAYTLVMPDGQQAELTYARIAPDQIVADHTFVPQAWRGRGLAERMVQRLVADARAAGTRITPTCWYVAAEFRRHGAEWDDVRKR